MAQRLLNLKKINRGRVFEKLLFPGGPFITQAVRRCSSTQPLTILKEEQGINIITLNNPKKRNALSLAMLDCLKANIEHSLKNSSLRVIIIRSQGPVFSAGHDLKELTTTEGREYHVKVFERCTEVMTLVQDAPVPVIAEVKGLATAAGCQLVASCDIALASIKAKFATPGVSVGLFCSTPAVAVGRAVPRKVAMEMLFTGHPITAQEAVQHGLVSRVVAEDQLEEEVMKVAERICETSRSVTALGKTVFNQQMELSRDEAYAVAGKAMADNLQLLDAQEGIRAFVEKRPAVWRHSEDTAH